MVTVLRTATARLAAAGVASPRADVEALAAHLLGTSRGDVAARALRGDPVPPALAGFDDLVARRAAREPLQHLTGLAAFRGVHVAVGPGVFVPRPETEVTAGLAVAEAARLLACGAPARVVDLCTGTGAIALAVAAEAPGANVHAVELDPDAHGWARRNLLGSGVDLRLGDAATALAELDGRVDVVVANPPYIPTGMVPVDPEVRDHDPAVALYGGGDDGLTVPRAVVAAAARLLRPGGLLVCEHADVQGPAVLSLLAGPTWHAAVDHMDLAARPRCATARRGAVGAHGTSGDLAARGAAQPPGP